LWEPGGLPQEPGHSPQRARHHVEVVTGPPDPLLHNGMTVHKIPCLDLYNPEDLFRVPSLRELLDPINLIEWIGVCSMGFPEPLTFGLRAYRFLGNKWGNYDVVHDNQSLSYGLLAINRMVPTVATIHHPITVDRELAVKSGTSLWKKMKHMRWYSFVGMQKRVSRFLSHIITVSECARADISNAFGVSPARFRIVPNGVNTELFRPLPTSGGSPTVSSSPTAPTHRSRDSVISLRRWPRSPGLMI
jgi:glycosyltransferase involved in cell wall biosynthesis